MFKWQFNFELNNKRNEKTDIAKRWYILPYQNNQLHLMDLKEDLECHNFEGMWIEIRAPSFKPWLVGVIIMSCHVPGFQCRFLQQNNGE